MHMCIKLSHVDLNLDPYPPHPTSSYTYRVTITPKMCSEIVENISEVDSSISNTFERQRDLGTSIIASNKDLTGIKLGDHIRGLSGGLVKAHDFGWVSNTEKSRVCPNELFRRRIEEIDSELKKLEDHVTESKGIEKQVNTSLEGKNQKTAGRKTTP